MGCPIQPLPDVVFVGTVTASDYRTARLRIDQSRAGDITQFAAGDLVDVRYGIDTKYLREGRQYLIAAVFDPAIDGLRSREAAPRRSTAVTRSSAPPRASSCVPEIVDAMRTIHVDGSSVDSGLLRPLVDDRQGVLRALLITDRPLDRGRVRAGVDPLDPDRIRTRRGDARHVGAGERIAPGDVPATATRSGVSRRSRDGAHRAAHGGAACGAARSAALAATGRSTAARRSADAGSARAAGSSRSGPSTPATLIVTHARSDWAAMREPIPGGPGWQMNGDSLVGEITDLDVFLAEHAVDRCVHVLAALFQHDPDGARRALQPLLVGSTRQPAAARARGRHLARRGPIRRGGRSVPSSHLGKHAAARAGDPDATSREGPLRRAASSPTPRSVSLGHWQLREEHGAEGDLVESSRRALERAEEERSARGRPT